MPRKKLRIVIALGGNAIEGKNGAGTYEKQVGQMALMARSLCRVLADRRYEAVITHGNGPQVGNILIQNAAARKIVPPLPMFVCDAMSQGEIGFSLARAVSDECVKRNSRKDIAAMITSVEVDKKDRAFKDPSKPVGPFYKREEAERISRRTGYVFKEDAGRGWRRFVPSPEPLRIMELGVIKKMLASGIVPIVCGGGGIPVVRSAKEGFSGVEAVIDKDKAAALLADRLDADLLVILTAVEKVSLNFGKKGERPVRAMSVKEAKVYLKSGEFLEGSMKPKIEAVLGFVGKKSSRRAIITHPLKILEALEGKTGTRIIYNQSRLN